MSGSVGKYLPYRVSLGYTGEQGIVKTSDFKRYTVSANLNPSLLNDHLVVNLNAKWMWGKNHYADGGAISNALRIDPTQPVSVASGFENFNNYFEWTSSNSDLGDSAWPVVTNTNAPRNPVAILELKNDRAHSHDFNGSADIDYKVHGFEDLRLHTTIGGDFSGGKQNTDVLPGCPQASYWGSYGWANGTKENLTWSEYLQYYKDFDDMNHFDIMAGHEWQHFWRKENSYYINHCHRRCRQCHPTGWHHPHRDPAKQRQGLPHRELPGVLLRTYAVQLCRALLPHLHLPCRRLFALQLAQGLRQPAVGLLPQRRSGLGHQQGELLEERYRTERPQAALGLG